MKVIFDSVEVIREFLDSRAATTILIDDVMTTGSTLAACADLLERAGARHVMPMALLRTAHVSEAGLDFAKVADEKRVSVGSPEGERDASIREIAYELVAQLPRDAGWRDLIDLIQSRLSLDRAMTALDEPQPRSPTDRSETGC